MDFFLPGFPTFWLCHQFECHKIYAYTTYCILQWRVAEVCQRLEHDFEILGVAAIEDRLQVIMSAMKYPSQFDDYIYSL